MKKLITILLLALTVAANAQVSVNEYNSEDIINDDYLQYDSLPEGYNTCAQNIKVTRFEKRGPEFYEYISIKNDNEVKLYHICLRILYYDSSGEMIHFRDILLDDDLYGPLPPGLTKTYKIPSFDQDQHFSSYESPYYEKVSIRYEILFFGYMQ